MRLNKLAAGCLAAFVLMAGVGSSVGVATTAELKSLKERLSDKASDNQRVNNCHVPVDRRGPVPRPGCPGGTAAPTPVAEQRDTKTQDQR
jgi:hypothetical protein